MSLREFSASDGGPLCSIFCEGGGPQKDALDVPGCVTGDPGSILAFSDFSRFSSFSTLKIAKIDNSSRVSSLHLK